MADGVFNIVKGALVEKFRDSAAAGGVILLQAAEADATLVDYDDIAALLVPAGNTEATATNYARKTGITGTITVDDTNDRVDLDIPDQVFSSLGGATNNSLVKLVTYYEESAADSGRIPGTHHDITVTTDGTDVTFQIAAAGIARFS